MGRTETNFWAFAQWRAESMVESRKTITMAYRHSIEVGDIHYALYAGINGGVMFLTSGEHLDDMEPTVAQISSSLRNMKALGSDLVESAYGILRCFKVLPTPITLPYPHPTLSLHIFIFLFYL